MPGAAEPFLHQIVYQWRETDLLGHRGVGPAATSYTTDAELRAIDRELLPYVRMQDADNSPRPANSLCFLQLSSRSVVLHRSSGHGNNRRDVNHALVGPPGALSAIEALALFDWTGWRHDDVENAVQLDRVACSTVQAERRRVGTQLRQLAWAERDVLAVLLTAGLANPMRAFGVLMPPERHPGPDTVARAVPLLWGWLEVLGPFLAGTEAQVTAHPSFSTYEPHLLDDKNRDLLDLVFAPQIGPPGSYGTSRTLVRPFDPDPGAVSAAASQLVDHYVEQDPDDLRRWLHDQQADVGGLPERVRRLTSLAVAQSPVPSSSPASPATPWSAPPPPAAHLQAPASAPVPVATLAAEGRPTVQQPRRDREPVAVAVGDARQPTPPAPIPAADAQTAHGLVRRLAGASEPRLAREVLRALGERCHAIGSTERRAIRQALVAEGFLAKHLTGLLPGWEARRAVAQLVAVAVGPSFEERIEPTTEWAFIADVATPSLVVREIVDLAADSAAVGYLVAWLGLRKVRLMGHQAPDEAALGRPYRVGGATLRIWWHRVATPSRRRLATRVSLAVLVLICTVLSVLLAARPESGALSPTPTGSSPATVPTCSMSGSGPIRC